MKGVVFKYLEEFVSENYGLQAWEELLDKCPLKSGKIFVGPSTYPDTDFLAIITMALREFNKDEKELIRAFGRFLFHGLARDYPTFLESHSEPKSFLLSVDSVIHVEVKKLLRETETPSFRYEDPGEKRLKIHYHSRRKLCVLMEGILVGVQEHFQVPLEVNHSSCMHHGSDECLFDLRFG